MNKTLERQSPNHDTNDHSSSHCGFFVHGRQLFSTSVAWNRSMHEEIVFYKYLFYRFDGLVSFYFYYVIFVIVTLVWRILLLIVLYQETNHSQVCENPKIPITLLPIDIGIEYIGCISVLCADVLTQGTYTVCRSRWQGGLRRGSAAARLPPERWKSVCCVCCVSLVRGLCDGPITHPEASYRVWCVWAWSRNLDSPEA